MPNWSKIILVSRNGVSNTDIGRLWAVGEYNSNNAWFYNPTNGALNNNNKYNAYQVRPLLDSEIYDNGSLQDYEIPLEEWYEVNRMCRRRKAMKPSCLIFQCHLVPQLTAVAHEVGNMEYVPREGICFIITVPRIREVLAADFGDRVIQTWYSRELNWWLENYHLHRDSYSCRVGRGGLMAVQQFQEYVYEVSNGFTSNCYVATMDLQSFFMSIDTYLASELMIRFINEKYQGRHKQLLIYLTRIIYQSQPQNHCIIKSRKSMWDGLPGSKSLLGKNDGIGIPIGNITSQMMANFLTTFYLNYIESLGYRFVHYTDDTAFVFSDKQRFLEDVNRLELFLNQKLHLNLHPDKRYIQHYSKGVKMLGYKLRYDRMLPSDRIVHNLYWKVDCAIRKAEESDLYMLREKDHFVQVVNSYLGLLKWCSAYKIRRDILTRIMDSKWNDALDIDDKNWMKVLPKKFYATIEYYKRKNKKRKKASLLACAA